MRSISSFAAILFAALTMAACSAVPAMSSLPAVGASNSSSNATVTATQTPGYSQSMSSDPKEAAVQTVIQKGDQEQQDAFAKNDPTIMQDTATADYYNQLVKINADMAHAGVASIKLVTIEWGPVTFPDSNTAKA